MAKLKNLKTGKVEDWNAYNNPQFSIVTGQPAGVQTDERTPGGEIAKPKRSQKAKEAKAEIDTQIAANNERIAKLREDMKNDPQKYERGALNLDLIDLYVEQFKLHMQKGVKTLEEYAALTGETIDDYMRVAWKHAAASMRPEREYTAAQTSPEPLTGQAGDVRESAAYAKLNEQVGNIMGRQSPEYQQMVMRDQAPRALTFMQRNPGYAERVAYGIGRPPAGVNEVYVATAFMNQKLAEGDIEAAEHIANSLSRRGTYFGQMVKSFDGAVDIYSPIPYIKEIVKQRQETFVKQSKIVTSKEAKTTEAKVNEIINKQVDQVKAAIRGDRPNMTQVNALIGKLICKD
jgi:hypothetical protein